MNTESPASPGHSVDGGSLQDIGCIRLVLKNKLEVKGLAGILSFP